MLTTPEPSLQVCTSYLRGRLVADSLIRIAIQTISAFVSVAVTKQGFALDLIFDFHAESSEDMDATTAFVSVFGYVFRRLVAIGL
jgi:hypothetical protein